MTLVFAFPVALATLLVERFLYQCIGGSLDRRRYTDLGRWVELSEGEGFTWSRMDRAELPRSSRPASRPPT